MRQIVRRPHGPINQAFSRMWWDEAARKVRFERIEPEDVFIDARHWPAGCHDPNSCARHERCMYIRCQHEHQDIKSAIREAEKASA